MSLLLNAMQKAAAEDRSAICFVSGKTGTGKTALLTEKARMLHEDAKVPYEDMAVIFQSERDASLARTMLLNAPVKAGCTPVSAKDLRFFGTFLSVSYELLRDNLALDCLDWFHSGFTVMDGEQEFDIAVRLMAENDYGIFKNNLRLKIGRALRGVFVGSEEENAGLKHLYDDLRAYLRDNRIIIREKLPEWVSYLGTHEDTKFPKVLMADNIHRLSVSELNALQTLAARSQECTFTVDPTFKAAEAIINFDANGDSLKDDSSKNDSSNDDSVNQNASSNALGNSNDETVGLEGKDSDVEGANSEGNNQYVGGFTNNINRVKTLVTSLKAKNDLKLITLEHNYRSSQLPLVCANILAGDTRSVKEGMPAPSGTIGLSSFTDSREAAMSIASQIEELRIRGAHYSEIGILYADGFMQKTLISVLREKNIPFENGLGDYLGSSTAAAWLVKVLRFSLSPVNSASGADAVYDRRFGDSGLRRSDTRGDRGTGERIPSRSVLFQKMRWFVTNVHNAEENANGKSVGSASSMKGANVEGGISASWILDYFEVEGRLKRNAQDYEQNLKSMRSVIDTIDALRANGQRSLLQAVAQFLCNYNVRGRYAFMKPSFPDCVRIAHYKVDTPYNFPFLFITDCNDGKISTIEGEETEAISDRESLYTAVRRCSFELNLSFMRTRTAKNGVMHQVYPSPLLTVFPEKYLSGDQVTLDSLKADRDSAFPEESLVSYEDFMNRFDAEQLAIIKSETPITLLSAPVGTGKTRMIAARILYLNQEHGVPFRKIFVSCFSKRAVAEVLDTIMHIKGLGSLSPVLDFPLFGTFESLCVKLLNKRLRISDFGYGRGFRIQKEELEYHHALSIASELKAWNSQEELEHTVSSWIDALYRDVYSSVSSEISDLCGESAFCTGGEAPLTDEALNDPCFKEFSARILRFKKDNNLMSMRDARCIATALVGEMKDQITDVVADEFQDFDALQLGFVNKLAEGGARLFAAGDPEQVIYEWRTGGERNFSCISGRYGVDVMSLCRNYRSTGIAKSASIILKDDNSALASSEGVNEDVRIVSFVDAEAEARYVGSRILELRSQGVDFKDIAVFFKAPIGAQRILIPLFERLDIPVSAWSARSRGIAVRNGDGARNNRASRDTVGVDDEGVSILSLHRSKGLEFKHVFIVDCVSSNGEVSGRIHSQLNERHLYYVGMTRALKSLDLLYVRLEDEGGDSTKMLDMISALRLCDPEASFLPNANENSAADCYETKNDNVDSQSLETDSIE